MVSVDHVCAYINEFLEWGGQVAHAHAILFLREYTWNTPAVSLVIPAFDDTGSLGSPPRQVAYSPG